MQSSIECCSATGGLQLGDYKLVISSRLSSRLIERGDRETDTRWQSTVRWQSIGLCSPTSESELRIPSVLLSRESLLDEASPVKLFVSRQFVSLAIALITMTIDTHKFGRLLHECDANRHRMAVALATNSVCCAFVNRRCSVSAERLLPIITSHSSS